MKIACLLPSDHFHAPVVLSALARRGDAELFALVTPKLPGGGMVLTRLIRLLRQSGADYLSAMAGMKATFLIHSWLERRSGQDGREREFRSVFDAMKELKIRSSTVQDINGRESEEMLRQFAPDLILSVFFNQIIAPRIIELAPVAANVHPSLLPAYRGVSPAFWILKNGEPAGGATIHRLTERLDAGELLLRQAVPVRSRDSVFRLYRRCAIAAGDLLLGHLDALVRDDLPPLPSDGETSSKFGKITPDAMREFRRTRHRFCHFFKPL